MVEHLWRDLNTATNPPSVPSNLTELERFWRDVWESLPRDRCSQLLASLWRSRRSLDGEPSSC